MSVALNGNLKDFGIAEVFQLIGQQRKTGLLEITGESRTVRLAFDEGAVVWASPVGRTEFAILGDRLVRCGLITRTRLDELMRESVASARPLPSLLVASSAIAESDLDEICDLLSRETIFEVMRWTGGSFHFSAQTIHHEMPREKLIAAEQILMDGLRMLDEWRTFKSLVPSEDIVFQRTGSLEVYRQRTGGSLQRQGGQVDRVFQLVDGRLTVRRVIDLSRLGTFEATRILAELKQIGLIEPLDAKSARRLQREQRRVTPVAEYVRWGFAAVLPLALLALLVSVGLEARPVGGHAVGAPIPRKPLEEVRQQFERRRLYHALEARRFITGDWPDDLSAPDLLAPLREFALAPASAHAYYYVERDDGIILLAPMR